MNPGLLKKEILVRRKRHSQNFYVNQLVTTLPEPFKNVSIMTSKFIPTLVPIVGLRVRQINRDSVKLSEIHHIVRSISAFHEVALILITLVKAAVCVQMWCNVAEQPNSPDVQIPYLFVQIWRRTEMTFTEKGGKVITKMMFCAHQ